MKKFTHLSSVGLGLLLITFGSFAPPVMAATATPTPAPTTNNSGQALEIAPPVITLSADPGQTITTQISLRDISTTKLIVSGQVNDFIAAGEDGTPKILLNETETDPYSIKGWINPVQSLLLAPREIKTLSVTIVVPADASPGGHYGVIRFTATPPELKGTGVSLSASLGSLLLITISGQVKENLTVEQFAASHNGHNSSLFESTPLDFIVRLKNNGNVHEQPVGQIVITDMFGRKTANVNVNLPPRNVLPASIRKFQEPLNSSILGSKHLFGRYHAVLTVTYSASKQTATSSLTFWVIPYRLIAVIIVFLVGSFFALRFLIGRYNQRILSRSHRGRRR